MTKACLDTKHWQRKRSPTSGRCNYVYTSHTRKKSVNPKHPGRTVLLVKCKPGHKRWKKSPRRCHPAGQKSRSRSHSPPATTPHAKATAIAHRVEKIVSKETTVAKAHKVAQQVKKAVEPALRRSARLSK